MFILFGILFLKLAGASMDTKSNILGEKVTFFGFIGWFVILFGTVVFCIAIGHLINSTLPVIDIPKDK